MMYPDSSLRDHLANLCILKLQQASTGRTHSLLKQVQLTCMLQRMRMQSLLQANSSSYSPSTASSPQFDVIASNGFPFSNAFAHSTFTFDNEYFSQDHTTDFHWDQDPLDSTLASSLSFDLLLTMGASQIAADTSADTSATSAIAASMIETDEQNLFSFGQLAAMPLGSYSEDFSRQVNVSTISDLAPTSYSSSTSSSSLSSPTLSSLTATIPQCSSGSNTISLNPQSSLSAIIVPQTGEPSYYDLLMATAPNEPLSQLLSTHAASVSSTTFMVAANCEDSLSHTQVTNKTNGNSNGNNTNNNSNINTNISNASNKNNNISSSGSSSNDLDIDTPSAYVMTACPPPTVPSQRTTIPLTTREIMDALSGQFTPQATEATAMTNGTSQYLASAASVESSMPCPQDKPRAILVLSQEKEQTQVHTSTATTTTAVVLTDEGVPQLEKDLRVPTSANSKASTVDDYLEDRMELDVDLALGSMTLSSPPVSPRKRGANPKRAPEIDGTSRPKKQKSRRQENCAGAAPISFSCNLRPRRLRLSTTTASTLESDDVPPELTKSKRRRPSEDSSSDSGSESAPSSPKTPPSNHDSHGHDTHLNRHDSRSKLDDLDQPLSLINRDTPDQSMSSPNSLVDSQRKNIPHDCNLAPMVVEVEAVINLNHMEDHGREAGILSTSLYTRYPATRQSPRLLKRLSSSAQPPHHRHSSKV
ncbi:hypothetical protein BGZ83_011642 [Gryganskiella cystojenkinii]|nr:hypothetical protein BGZ83_011642 [Gryganskiella cystojenkinii]